MVARRPRRQAQRAAKAAASNAEDKATPPPTSKSAAGPRHEKAEASRNNAKEAVPNLLPSHQEVLAAVQSLYEDELKPFGRILRKRVAERAAMAAALTTFTVIEDIGGCNEKSLPDVDIKHLRATCEASEYLVVEPEEGGDWSALIRGCPQAFVNVYSPLDIYPPELWGAASAYFEVLTGEEMHLPGGRYSCAQALLARNLPFLVGRSLGQVCHIVQLAISQKKLLGYLNGAVVPYASSQSMVKEQCAVWQQPCTTNVNQQAVGATPSTLPMASWETARMCLRDILENAARSGSGPGIVPLSNVKRLFRSRFHVELSETMLGHSKLSELLQDLHFQDICTVQLQGHGYIVVQVQAPEGHTISLAENLPTYAGLSELNADSAPFEPTVLADDEPRRVEFCPDEPLLLEESISNSNAREGVQAEDSTRAMSRLPALSPSALCKDGVVGSMVRSTFIHAAPPPPTPPAGTRRRSLSLPKDVGSEKSDWETACRALAFMPRPMGLSHEPDESTADSSRSKARSTEEHSTRSGSSGTASSPSPSGCDLLQSVCLDQRPALDDPVKVLLRECNQFDHGPSIFAGSNSNDSLDDFTAPRSPLGGGETAPARLQFCPDEPLSFEDAEIFGEPPSGVRPGSLSPNRPRPLGLLDGLSPISLTPSLTPTRSAASAGNQRGASKRFPAVPRWPTLSPTPLVQDGCVGSIALSKVQNTFIHSPLPPPTPLRFGAGRRSRSLPKDVGSDKDAWEVTCQALGAMPRPKQQEEDYRESDVSFFPGYTPSGPCSLASSPAFVPPSPALTASPTYCGSRTPRPLLVPATGPPSPTANKGANPVLRLADLIF